MPQFRKKPVVIAAFQFSHDDIPDWFMDRVSAGTILLRGSSEYGQRPAACEIQTLEGTMVGDAGDYIIQGVKGEIYPCKPDIFAATYDPVEETVF